VSAHLSERLPSEPSASWDAIQLHPADSVAVALRDLPAGSVAAVRHPDGDKLGACELGVRAAITMGHKVALQDLPAGAMVLKYGEAIGQLTAAVAAGEHVHVHNLTSCRARARKEKERG